jgi:hypothetical protein
VKTSEGHTDAFVSPASPSPLTEGSALTPTNVLPPQCATTGNVSTWTARSNVSATLDIASLQTLKVVQVCFIFPFLSSGRTSSLVWEELLEGPPSPV